MPFPHAPIHILTDQRVKIRPIIGGSSLEDRNARFGASRDVGAYQISKMAEKRKVMWCGDNAAQEVHHG